MSIINLEKTFVNGQLVYYNLDNKIIECVCLSKLSEYLGISFNNEDSGTFICNKVKVITIYDTYKNIIYEPIQTDLFKKPIKIGTILENLKEKDIYFFKTFIKAFIKNNKLNSIEYHLNYKRYICRFIYNDIKLIPNTFIKSFNIYNNEGNCIYIIKYCEDSIISYRKHNDIINYIIFDDHIVITKGNYPIYQTISCNKKNLKIYEIEDFYENTYQIYEKRNNNNEITFLCKHDKSKLKEFFVSDNTNPPFSKPLKKDYIKLLNYYKKNINKCVEITNSCLHKEEEIHNILLLNN